MDSYFPKTRRPIVGLSGSLKRPASDATTPPRPAKIPATPKTPKDARIQRPLLPPPVKRKSELQVEAATRQRVSAELKNRPISVKELFKSARPLNQHPQRKATTQSLATKLSTSTTLAAPLSSTTITTTSTPTTPIKSHTPLTTPLLFNREPASSTETTATTASTTSVASRLGLVELRLPTPTSPIKTTKQAQTFTPSPIKSGSSTPIPVSPSKITSGPLKGVSTSLLDLIRAKEAAAKAVSPQQVRERELLGIAPAIVRIVPTVFTANKKEVMLYDKVVEKCFKGLKSNYTTQTIIECIDLLDRITPEWISTVKISRGKFMRINREKYTIAQLLEAIRRFKTKNC